MASVGEGDCHKDPNFAVICSFLDKYSTILGLPEISYTELQNYLEDTSKDVSKVLIDIHVRLLRRIGKSTVTPERFEKSIIKFIHHYSEFDAWEVESYGYKHAKLDTKLRILKTLLECQFDYNLKFKEKVNETSAEDMRFMPIGRDKEGQAYWYFLDKDMNLLVYKEEQDDDAANTWQLVCSDRNELAKLVNSLQNGVHGGAPTEDKEKQSTIDPDNSKEGCNEKDIAVKLEENVSEGTADSSKEKFIEIKIHKCDSLDLVKNESLKASKQASQKSKSAGEKKVEVKKEHEDELVKDCSIKTENILDDLSETSDKCLPDDASMTLCDENRSKDGPVGNMNEQNNIQDKTELKVGKELAKDCLQSNSPAPILLDRKKASEENLEDVEILENTTEKVKMKKTNISEVEVMSVDQKNSDTTSVCIDEVHITSCANLNEADNLDPKNSMIDDLIEKQNLKEAMEQDKTLTDIEPQTVAQEPSPIVNEKQEKSLENLLPLNNSVANNSSSIDEKVQSSLLEEKNSETIVETLCETKSTSEQIGVEEKCILTTTSMQDNSDLDTTHLNPASSLQPSNTSKEPPDKPVDSKVESIKNDEESEFQTKTDKGTSGKHQSQTAEQTKEDQSEDDCKSACCVESDNLKLTDTISTVNVTVKECMTASDAEKMYETSANNGDETATHMEMCELPKNTQEEDILVPKIEETLTNVNNKNLSSEIISQKEQSNLSIEVSEMKEDNCSEEDSNSNNTTKDAKDGIVGDNTPVNNVKEDTTVIVPENRPSIVNTSPTETTNTESSLLQEKLSINKNKDSEKELSDVINADESLSSIEEEKANSPITEENGEMILASGKNEADPLEVIASNGNKRLDTKITAEQNTQESPLLDENPAYSSTEDKHLISECCAVKNIPAVCLTDDTQTAKDSIVSDIVENTHPEEKTCSDDNCKVVTTSLISDRVESYLNEEVTDESKAVKSFSTSGKVENTCSEEILASDNCKMVITYPDSETVESTLTEETDGASLRVKASSTFDAIKSTQSEEISDNIKTVENSSGTKDKNHTEIVVDVNKTFTTSSTSETIKETLTEEKSSLIYNNTAVESIHSGEISDDSKTVKTSSTSDIIKNVVTKDILEDCKAVEFSSISKNTESIHNEEISGGSKTDETFTFSDNKESTQIESWHDTNNSDSKPAETSSTSETTESTHGYHVVIVDTGSRSVKTLESSHPENAPDDSTSVAVSPVSAPVVSIQVEDRKTTEKTCTIENPMDEISVSNKTLLADTTMTASDKAELMSSNDVNSPFIPASSEENIFSDSNLSAERSASLDNVDNIQPEKLSANEESKPCFTQNLAEEISSTEHKDSTDFPGTVEHETSTSENNKVTEDHTICAAVEYIPSKQESVGEKENVQSSENDANKSLLIICDNNISQGSVETPACVEISLTSTGKVHDLKNLKRNESAIMDKQMNIQDDQGISTEITDLNPQCKKSRKSKKTKSTKANENDAKEKTPADKVLTPGKMPKFVDSHRNLKRSAPEPGSDEPLEIEPDGKRPKQANKMQRSRRGRNAAARGRAARQAHVDTDSDDSETPLSQIRMKRQIKALSPKLNSSKTQTETPRKKKSEKAGEEVVANGKRAKKKKPDSSSDSATEVEVTPAKKGRNLNQNSVANKKAATPAQGKSKKSAPKAQPKSQKVDDAAGIRRSLRVQQLKAKRPPTPSSPSEGSEDEDSEAENKDQDFFDSSFTPEEESGDEEFRPKGRNFQRQAARTGKVNEEVINDDTPCVKCGKYNHPEMILLCDKCDAGYHTACLRPPLMLIPDGDWFCPPCEHSMLINKLLECLQTLDNAVKKKDRLSKRQERLAYVGINISNILHSDRRTSVHDKNEIDDNAYKENDASDKEDSESSSSDSEVPKRTFRSERLALRQAERRSRHEKHKLRRGLHSRSPDEEVQTKRTCRLRNTVSYQFKEFDELISNAIADDKPCRREKPPGIRRGKDMSNILGASDEEDEKIRLRDGDSAVPPPVLKKRSKRKLTKLDSDEEPDEEDESEEFKISEEDNSSEASDVEEEEDASSNSPDSGDWKPKKTWYNSHSPSHRPKRKAKSFVIDDDDYESNEEHSSKRRSTRNSNRGRIHYNVWDSEDEEETEEEQSTSEFCSDNSGSSSGKKQKHKTANKKKGKSKEEEPDSQSDSSIARRQKLLRKLVKKRRKDDTDSQETEEEQEAKEDKVSKKRNKRDSSDETDYSDTDINEDSDDAPKFKKKNVLRSSDEDTETSVVENVEKAVIDEIKEEKPKSDIPPLEVPKSEEATETRPEEVAKSKAKIGPKSKTRQAKGKKRCDKQDTSNTLNVANEDVPDKMRKVSDDEGEHPEEIKPPASATVKKPPTRRARVKSKELTVVAEQLEKKLTASDDKNDERNAAQPAIQAAKKKKKVPNFLNVPSGGEESDDQKSNKSPRLSTDSSEKKVPLKTEQAPVTPAAPSHVDPPTGYGNFQFPGQQAHQHPMHLPHNQAHFHSSHTKPEDMTMYKQEHSLQLHPTLTPQHRQMMPCQPPSHFDHPRFPPHGSVNPMHQVGPAIRHAHPPYPGPPGANPPYHYQPSMNQGYPNQEPGEVVSHKPGPHPNFTNSQISQPPSGLAPQGSMQQSANFHVNQQKDVAGGFTQSYGPNRMPLPHETMPQSRQEPGLGNAREMALGQPRDMTQSGYVSSLGHFREMGPGHVREMGPGHIREMGPGHNREMGPGHNREMGPGHVREMGPGHVREMGPGHVREMGPGHNREMGPGHVREMGPGNVREMGPGHVREMGPGHVREMGPGHVREMGPGHVREMGPGNVREMGPGHVREMGPGHVREMGPGHVREMGPGHVREMGPGTRAMSPGNAQHPYFGMHPGMHNLHQHYPPHYSGGMASHQMASPLNSMGQMTKNLGHESSNPPATFTGVPAGGDLGKEQHQSIIPHRLDTEQQHYAHDKSEINATKKSEGKKAKASNKSKSKSKVSCPPTDPQVTASKVPKKNMGEETVLPEKKDVPASVADSMQPGMMGYKSQEQAYGSHASPYPTPFAAHSQHHAMPMSHMPPKHASFMPPAAHMPHGATTPSTYKPETGHAATSDVKSNIAEGKGEMPKQTMSPTDQRSSFSYPPNVSPSTPAKSTSESPSHPAQVNPAMSYPQRYPGPQGHMPPHGSYYHGHYYQPYGPSPGQPMHPPNAWPQNMSPYGPRMGSPNVYPYGVNPHPESVSQANMMNTPQNTKVSQPANVGSNKGNMESMNAQFSKSPRHSGSEEDHPNPAEKSDAQKAQSVIKKEISESSKSTSDVESAKDSKESQQNVPHSSPQLAHRSHLPSSAASSQSSESTPAGQPAATSTSAPGVSKQPPHPAPPVSTAAMHNWAEAAHYQQHGVGSWPALNDPGQYRMMQSYGHPGMMGGLHYPPQFQQPPAHSNVHPDQNPGHTESRPMGPGTYIPSGSYPGYDKNYQSAHHPQGPECSRGPQRPDFSSKQTFNPQSQEKSQSLHPDQKQSGDDTTAESNAASKPKRAKTQKKSPKDGASSGRVRSAKGWGRGRGGFTIDNLLQARGIEVEDEGEDSSEMKDIVSYVTTDEYFKQQTSS